MIKRCYDKNTQIKRPSYIGCSVCEDWLTFSNFKAWMETQDWKGKYLDKDILKSDNRIYGPDRCVFVSNRINNLHKAVSSFSGFSIHKPTGKWRAYFAFEGKQKHLGLFKRERDAAIRATLYKKEFIESDKELSKSPVVRECFLREINKRISEIA